ncbi:Pro-kumamolisin, activation domain-containing protein [Rhodocollybia butyracea]|uniref:Pro-kumamolisin, activation domain-containing protein n=1 Tax=Rhodocollybia butyracea TaxID=206335 RepID=A0A9P5PE23_9AGAR|nr:Pro-kumamolisin, activation domain-containing protein [Rhodocollybia butyracea]
MAAGTPSCRLMVMLESSEPPAYFANASSPTPDTTLHLKIALTAVDRDCLEQKLFDVSTPGKALYGQHLGYEEVCPVKVRMAGSSVSPIPDTVQAVTSWLNENGIQNNATTGAFSEWLGLSAPVSTVNSLFNTNYQLFNEIDGPTKLTRTLTYSIPDDLQPYINHASSGTDFVRVSKGSPPSTKFHSTIPSRSSTNTARIPAHKATQTSNNLGATGFLDQWPQMVVQTRKAPRKLLLKQLQPTLLKVYHWPGQWGTSNIFLSRQRQTDGGLDGSLDLMNYINSQSYSENRARHRLKALILIICASPAPELRETVIICACDGAWFHASLTTQNRALPYPPPPRLYPPPPRPYPPSPRPCPPSPRPCPPSPNNDGGLGGFLDLMEDINSLSSPPFVLTTSYGTDEHEISTAQANQLCDAYMVAASVGATQGEQETGASFSGGGFSNIFARPSYQADAVGGYLSTLGNTNANLFNPSGHAYPDVSAQGEVGTVDGTSCSAPVFASIIALINNRLIAAGRCLLLFKPIVIPLASLQKLDYSSLVRYAPLQTLSLRVVIFLPIEELSDFRRSDLAKVEELWVGVTDGA